MAFNNSPFNATKIGSMHSTMERLYRAASAMLNIDGQSSSE